MCLNGVLEELTDWPSDIKRRNYTEEVRSESWLLSVTTDSVVKTDPQRRWGASRTKWWSSSSRTSPTITSTLNVVFKRSSQPVSDDCRQFSTCSVDLSLRAQVLNNVEDLTQIDLIQVRSWPRPDLTDSTGLRLDWKKQLLWHSSQYHVQKYAEQAETLGGHWR